MKTRNQIINSCCTIEELGNGLYSIDSINRIIDLVSSEVVREQKWNCAERAVLGVDELRHPSTDSVGVKDIILSAKSAYID